MGQCNTKYKSQVNTMIIPPTNPWSTNQKVNNPNPIPPNPTISTDSNKISPNQSSPNNTNIYQILINQLGEFQLPILGLRGIDNQQWKQIKIKQNNNSWWYLGQWKNQLMQGYGNLYNTNNKILITGIFLSHEILESKCRIIYQNGAYYVGPINKQYQPSGYGIMYYCDGSQYNGEFSQGIPTGNKSEDKYIIYNNLIRKSDRNHLNDQERLSESNYNIRKVQTGINTTKNNQHKLTLPKQPPKQPIDNKQNILN